MSGFVSPWLLAGLLSVAVPVIVHLVNRRERKGLGFPSLMFIRQTRQRVRQSRTLRDRGLLLLRCLALVLLVTAFAGPIVGGSTAANEGFAKATVLLLDRSYSMSHSDRWSMALELVADRIAAMATNERLALLAFDDEVTTLQDFTADKTLLKTALAGLTARDRTTKFHLAFAAAARRLTDVAADKSSVALVSDLQRVGFGPMDEIALAADLDLELYAVDSPAGANGVVMGVADVGPAVDGTGATGLSVLVANTGDQPLADAALRLEVEGREQFSERIDLPAGSERRMEVPVTPAADRYLPLRVSVTADDLNADNTFVLVLPPTRPVSVLLVGSAPAARSGADFVGQALAASAVFDLRVLTASALTAGDLQAVQVLVLDDVALGSGSINKIVDSFVRNGGSVLVLTGDNFDQGPALLVGNAARVDRVDNPASVNRLHERHPLWLGLGLNAQAGLEQAGISRYRSLALQPSDQVLAWYDDGEPFLVERTSGDGLALIMTTSLERRWSDLGLHPYIVPLLRELVRYSAAAVNSRMSHTVGDLVPVMGAENTVPGQATGGDIVVEHPLGAQTVLFAGAAVMRVPEPGIYQVHGAQLARAPALFAVNSDRSESALAALSETAFRERVVRGASRGGQKTGRPRFEQAESSNLWWYLLLLAGLAMLIECAISNRRAGNVGQPQSTPRTVAR